MLSYSDGSPHARKAPTPSGCEFAFDGVGPNGGPRRMPVGDGLPIVGVLCARRVGQLDEAVARLADEPLADLSPQRHQVTFGFGILSSSRPGTLVHREEHLRVVERANGLRRHIIGVARPDTDDVDQAHIGRVVGSRSFTCRYLPVTQSMQYRGY